MVSYLHLFWYFLQETFWVHENGGHRCWKSSSWGDYLWYFTPKVAGKISQPSLTEVVVWPLLKSLDFVYFLSFFFVMWTVLRYMHTGCKGGVGTSRFLTSSVESGCGLVMGLHNNEKKEGSRIHREHLLFVFKFQMTHNSPRTAC